MSPRRLLRGAGGALASVLAAVAAAATIEERRIDVRIEGDAVVTRESLRVVLEEEGDLDAWRRYLVFMDENAEIEEIEAAVQDGNGKTIATVPRRAHERVQSPGYDLYSSEWIHVVPFPPLSIGQRLSVDVRIRERPYYPSTSVLLAQGSRQRSLRVSVVAPGKKLRYRANDAAFPVVEIPDGIEIRAHDVPAPPDVGLAPEITEAPVLRVAWDGGATWPSVGAWYQELIAAKQSASPAAAAKAAELTAAIAPPRDRIGALLSFVRTRIRYEAVEIGVGGWVPHPAGVTLERGFGDCKDKAELLRQMLAAAGIPASLVLLHAGAERAVDEAFPTPDQFNHCIVGIPADKAGARSGDPVAGGLLLVDPTVERGGLGWLSPLDRGDVALVVAGDASRLVGIGVDPAAERRVLSIEGSIDAGGVLAADIRLHLSGREAATWLSRAASERPSATDAAVRQLLGKLLPAATLEDAAWSEVPGEVPAVTLTARARQPDALRGEAPDRWLPAPALTAFPSPRLCEKRTLPVLLSAGESRTTWRIAITGCAPEPVDELEENAAGRVRHRVSRGPKGEVVVEREAVVSTARVEAPGMADLAKLAVAEARAEKRRTRLTCR